MELLRKIQWSMLFMLFHGHVLLRAFWMNSQSPTLRTWRKWTSLYMIIKKDPVGNFHVSRSLHVLLGCISLLKKFVQYSKNWTSSFGRKLQNTSQQRINKEYYHLWNQRLKKIKQFYLVMGKYTSFKTEDKETVISWLDWEQGPSYCSFPWLLIG